jgi:hypothetical protein
MRHIPLAPECGQVEMNDKLAQYTNELGDRRMIAMPADGDGETWIATSDWIDGEWQKPVRAKGVDGTDANYPFLMPDGVTLYYSERGSKSIGGYDIYVTRYDAESGAFLRPENIGMPFTSESNDFFYAIDEVNHLGYFVTDRRQPYGKVCIYVFIPPTTRRSYDPDAYSAQDLRSLASIRCIADTWTNRNQVSQAKERLKKAKAAFFTQKPQGDRQLTELDELRRKAELLEMTLAKARKYYAHADYNERAAMKDEMLRNERELEALQTSIKRKEKAERNQLFINKH